MTAALTVIGLLAAAAAFIAVAANRADKQARRRAAAERAAHEAIDPNTTPAPLDPIYHRLEALYQAPAAERRTQ